MSWWEVICEPRAEQYDVEGEERAPAGLVVLVTDGQVKSVIGRVAYTRWRSARPWRSFKRSLRGVIARAQAETIMLNGRVAQTEREGLVSAAPPPNFGSED